MRWIQKKRDELDSYNVVEVAGREARQASMTLPGSMGLGASLGDDRIFVKPHTKIECDPKVWKQAEDLIGAALPPATSSGSTPQSIP
jgi:hypothetical protein